MPRSKAFRVQFPRLRSDQFRLEPNRCGGRGSLTCNCGNGHVVEFAEAFGRGSHDGWRG